MTESLAIVATYSRELGASLERMFENALDWEHLPFVHARSFASIDLIAERPDGWRAAVTMAGGGDLVIDLGLDRSLGRWTTDSKADGKLIGRIVTDAMATGAESCRVDIDFQLPDVPPEQRAGFERYYPALYAMLYDEDEAMMIARQGAVSRGPSGLAERRQAHMPDGTPVSVARYCPHLGLPLDDEPDENGIITCPWHGYRFDAATGQCVSGAKCGWTV